MTMHRIDSPGASDFIQLGDVPNSYAGFANYIVAVNSSATGLTFVASASTSIGIGDAIAGGDINDILFVGNDGMGNAVLSQDDNFNYTTGTLSIKGSGLFGNGGQINIGSGGSQVRYDGGGNMVIDCATGQEMAFLSTGGLYLHNASSTGLSIDTSGNTQINGTLEVGGNYIFPTTAGTSGETIIRGSGTATSWGFPTAGEIVIGNPVNGGDANDVLFVDASGNLGQNDLFYYDQVGLQTQIENGGSNFYQDGTTGTTTISSYGIAQMQVSDNTGIQQIGDIDGDWAFDLLKIDGPNRLITFQDSGALYLSIDNMSRSYQLGDISGAGNSTILNVDDASGTIVSNSEFIAPSIQTSTVFDSSAVLAENVDARVFFDVTALPSMDANVRKTTWIDGATTIFDWANDQMNDTTGSISQDFVNRWSYNTSGNVTWDYEASQINDTTGLLSLDANARIGYGTDGTTQMFKWASTTKFEVTQDTQLAGNLNFASPSPIITITTGPRAGTATFGTGGTITVANPSVTANTMIFTTNSRGTVTNLGIKKESRSVGVSFTIASLNPLDASTFDWILIEKT